MPTLNQLHAAINNLLQAGAHGAGYQLVRDVEEKAYEAYVFGLCVEAVRRCGGTIDYRTISGTPGPLLFRGGPGEIHSTHRNYGYAYCTLGTRQFEIHVDVEFEGTSRATHEIDVAILDADHADKCRTTPCDPKAAGLIAAFECKFYDDTLGISLAREFVGALDDLGSSVRERGLVCNRDGKASTKDYLQVKRRPQPHFLLSPLHPENEETLIGNLKAVLRKWAQI